MAAPRIHLLITVAVACIALFAAACGSEDIIDTVDDSQPGDTDTTRPSLAGRWELVSLDVDGVAVAIPADVDLEMEIELGQIGGSGGCNSFGGAIEIGDDGSLAIANMAWTEMACEPFEILDFETVYLTALSGVTSWEADPDGITFTSETARLRYEAGTAPVDLPLENTAWVFDTVFSGEGVNRAASTTDRSSPDVTIVFTAQGATLTTDDCAAVSLAVNYEAGGEGNLNTPDPIDPSTLDCDNVNLRTALKALADSSDYMIDESRLTLIGTPGELIGLRG